MNRRDWLALFLALEGAPDGLDPVRIQKGMFLFAMQGEIDPAERYPFKPYDYGPMSTGVYVDLERLAREGLLVRSPVVGKRWSRFSATDAGLEAGHRLVRQARDDGRLTAVHTLHRLKHQVAGLPFNELLKRVYAEYPEYAVNSVFERSA